MNLKATYIITFLNICTIFSQNNNIYNKEGHLRKTDWKEENLRRNVLSYIETTIPKKLIVDKISGLSKEKFVFNKQGNLIERDFYSGQKWTCRYDKQGNQIEFRNCSSSNGCIRSIFKYSIKENKKIVRHYQIREWMEDESDEYVHEKWIYFYKNNFLKKTERYRGENELTQEITYSYDNDNLIEVYEIYNKEEHSKDCLEYDNKGRIKKLIIGCIDKVSLRNGIDKIITYSYDENNNITKEKYGSYPEDKIYKIITYQYEYDKNGNWVKCTKYKNEEPIIVIQRKYKYFN